MIGGGNFNLKPGEWTDDTAMALALADSLLDNDGLDTYHLMDCWLRWMNEGKYSCTHTCFDIGVNTSIALRHYQQNRLFNGKGVSNGCIMRLAPVAIFAISRKEALRLAHDQARLTHGDEAASVASRLSGDIYDAINSVMQGYEWEDYPRQRDAIPTRINDAEWTFRAAQWAIKSTSDFRSALIAAVNLGDDADTIGAVTGQLAGAYYGAKAIPSEWLDTLVWRDKIEEIAAELFTQQHFPE